MPFPTHSQWMAMTKSAIDNYSSDTMLSQAQYDKWQEHVTYRTSLVTYGEGVLDSAEFGPGSNPPGNPPPPPNP